MPQNRDLERYASLGSRLDSQLLDNRSPKNSPKGPYDSPYPRADSVQALENDLYLLQRRLNQAKADRERREVTELEERERGLKERLRQLEDQDQSDQ